MPQLQRASNLFLPCLRVVGMSTSMIVLRNYALSISSVSKCCAPMPELPSPLGQPLPTISEQIHSGFWSTKLAQSIDLDYRSDASLSIRFA